MTEFEPDIDSKCGLRGDLHVALLDALEAAAFGADAIERGVDGGEDILTGFVRDGGARDGGRFVDEGDFDVRGGGAARIRDAAAQSGLKRLPQEQGRPDE